MCFFNMPKNNSSTCVCVYFWTLQYCAVLNQFDSPILNVSSTTERSILKVYCADSLITLNVSIGHWIYMLELATVLKRFQKEAPGTCLILKTHSKWFDQTETTQLLFAEMTFQQWLRRHPNIWLLMRPSLLMLTVLVCCNKSLKSLSQVIWEWQSYYLIRGLTTRCWHPILYYIYYDFLI